MLFDTSDNPSWHLVRLWSLINSGKIHYAVGMLEGIGGMLFMLLGKTNYFPKLSETFKTFLSWL